ncbi:helix-turn-helix domain-containing protein [Deinococcus cavernae]|nr:helix-turn-helix transcriptional regulator [Deinococcus cavernae]
MEMARSRHDEGSGKEARKYVPTAESVRRGQRLEQWLKEHEFEASEFSREANISKMSISLYLQGKLDVANMRQRTVEKLLGAMHVSDSWAWTFFDIPEARRKEWRTFRDAPMGHGEEAPQQVVTFLLDASLSGEGYALPEGTTLTLDPLSLTRGLLVCRLPGRYVLARPDAVPAQGEVLGQLVKVAPAAHE